MKKFLILLLALIIGCILLISCGKNPAENSTTGESSVSVTEVTAVATEDSSPNATTAVEETSQAITETNQTTVAPTETTSIGTTSAVTVETTEAATTSESTSATVSTTETPTVTTEATTTATTAATSAEATTVPISTAEATTSSTEATTQVTTDNPYVAVDFDFSNGTVSDKKGNVSAKTFGSAYTTTAKVRFQGKTYNADALKTSGGSYVLCEFEQLKDSTSFKAFAENGFTVEAFYAVGSSSSVQGIICGTEYGGWGLANRASSVPYFIVGTGSQTNTYKSVDATTAMSSSELTHVMAVYDSKKGKISIYINGVFSAETAIDSEFFCGVGDTFNRFCLGDDIKPNGVGGHFPTNGGMTMVTAKIYAKALTASEIQSSFESAVASLGDEITSGGSTGGGGSATEANTTFDENNIIFSFGAISDVHIANGNDNDESSKKFKSALEQLKAKALLNDKDGIDAIFTAGDLIDSRQTVQIQEYKKIYQSIFDETLIPNIYCLGHYHDDYWTADAVNTDRNNITNVLGSTFLEYDVEPDRIPTGCRHCVITADNGTVYHVLTMEPISMQPTLYSTESKTWLDNTLKEITTEHPDQYVFLLNHCMIYNTVYGSDLGTYWYTDDLTSILSNYPQVMTFSGHLHFPLNDERSIMQTSFTALGTGAVRYMAIEDGNYENMASSTTMNDRYEFSEGLLVQIDIYGNVRITRMDFYNETTIGDNWELSHPTESGSHLNKYTREGRTESNTAPVLNNIKVDQTVLSAGISATAVFNAGVDDEFVHHYVLSLYKGNVKIKQYNILSDFYKYGDVSKMKKSISQSLNVLEFDTDYTLTLIGYDSWGATSNMLKYDFHTESSQDSGGSETAELPDAYADLIVNSSGLKDSKGHVSIVANTGTITQQTLAFQNVSKSKYVLYTNGTSATCKFDSLTTASAFKAWAQNGFTVEAFFTSSSSSTTQGVVCGTQGGGWGLAVNESSVPYFITGSGKSANVYNEKTVATSSVKSGELIHVVAVYDYPNRIQRLYVNGVLQSQTSVNNDYFPGAGMAYNMFCLGADITATGGDTDYKSSGMSILNAKIYSSALNSAQVKTAFNNAVTDFSN